MSSIITLINTISGTEYIINKSYSINRQLLDLIPDGIKYGWRYDFKFLSLDNEEMTENEVINNHNDKFQVVILHPSPNNIIKRHDNIKTILRGNMPNIPLLLYHIGPDPYQVAPDLAPYCTRSYYEKYTNLFEFHNENCNIKFCDLIDYDYVRYIIDGTNTELTLCQCFIEICKIKKATGLGNCIRIQIKEYNYEDCYIYEPSPDPSDHEAYKLYLEKCDKLDEKRSQYNKLEEQEYQLQLINCESILKDLLHENKFVLYNNSWTHYNIWYEDNWTQEHLIPFYYEKIDNIYTIPETYYIWADEMYENNELDSDEE